MLISLPNVELRELLSGIKNNLRPVKEIFNKQKFDFPSSYDTGIKRIVTNINYFYGNYLLVVAIFIVIAIITTPALLVVLGCSLALSVFLFKKNVERKFSVLGKEIILNTKDQLKGIGVVCFVMFWLVGGTAALSWVVFMSVLSILGHSISYNAEKIIPGSSVTVEEV